MCEGMARLPLPGQLLQNLPAPTFHPFLKGKSLLPNSACPKPHSWVEEKTGQGGKMNTKRLFLALLPRL